MNTLENYRILMDSLNPQNPPVVQFVHRATPPQPKHIGVLDASFNPLTLAHEALVHQAQNAFGFDEIVLLLAKTNVDKALFGADLGQRLAMMVNYANSDTQLDAYLSIAVCSHARFIDKAHALRAHISPDAQIYFLVGHDTLIRIFDPRLLHRHVRRTQSTVFTLPYCICEPRKLFAGNLSQIYVTPRMRAFCKPRTSSSTTPILWQYFLY